MMTETLIPNYIRLKLRKNVVLSDLTTFRIGGPAEMFFEAATQAELIEVFNWTKKAKIPRFILGGGSNLVVSDDGIDGVVIANKVRDLMSVDSDKMQISVSSGHKLSTVVNLASEKGLAGFECFAGIPGSIGGAIYGNAGAYGKSIADLLIQAEVLYPDGKIRRVPNSFFDFDYRTSILKTSPYIVLSAVFSLQHGNCAGIREKIDEIMNQRASKHPPKEIGCAGSFFKNLPPGPGETRRRAAGELLDKVGAKQMSSGGASVYEKHANFIINKSCATCSDVRTLARMMKMKVKETYGTMLDEEVLYIGRF